MPKQLLSGTLEEQCEVLYNLAEEKIRQGNYTGAVHALAEIVKHKPDFRDVAALLADVKRRKSVQTQLLWGGFIGAALGVGVGTLLQVRNDWVLLALAAAGVLTGYGLGNWILGRRLVP